MKEITHADLQALIKIHRSVSFKEVRDWFNENDIDYIGMNDLEMYIKYIESHPLKNGK